MAPKGRSRGAAPADHRRRPIRGRVVAVAVLVGLHALLYVATEAERAALASRHWTPVAGEVLATRIWDTAPGIYQPAVTYEFHAADRPWRTARHGFWPSSAPSFGSEEAAADWLAEQAYTAGSTVTVFVDPARPDLAVLDRRISMLRMLPALAAAGALLLVDLFIVGAWVLEGFRAARRRRVRAGAPEPLPAPVPAAVPPRAKARPRRPAAAAAPPHPWRERALLALGFSIPMLIVVTLNALVYFAADDAIAALRSERWVRTTGQVVDTRIVEERSESEDGHSVSRFRPAVTYEYEAAGRQWRAARYGFTAGAALPLLPSAEAARRYLVDHHLEPGSAVTVHYDPRSPERAVLNPHVEYAGFILQGLGAAVVLLLDALVVMGLAGAWRNARARRRKTASLEAGAAS
jgi:hypothetical protein